MRHLAPSLFLVLLCAGLTAFAQTPPAKPNPKITLQVAEDYLALHATGTAPAGTQVLEHRLTISSPDASPAVWVPVTIEAKDNTFTFDVPLPDWRWAKLEVRALIDGTLVATKAIAPRQQSLTLITPERVASLPDTLRAQWQTYIDTSRSHAEHERGVMAAECRSLRMAHSKAAPAAKTEFEMDSDVPPEWYGSAEALKTAEAVLSFQTPTGAWSKAIDYTSGPRSKGTQWTNNAGNPWHYCGTLDNRTTTEQIKFLAHVSNAVASTPAKTGALRGIEWLITAQFPNGGWPQVYPLESGYHEAITLNDGAMLHALEVLLSVSKGEAPFAFVDASIRARAASAFDKGIACLLASQLKVAGKLAVWCAQHDPLSLAPVAARLKEPPSLSGAESAELLRFLMRKGPVTPDIVAAIQGGIDWLTSNQVANLRKTKNAEGKTDYIPDPASSEVYWARFYDVQSGQPIFAGAQDGKIYHTFHEMARHNKVAYDYFTTKPADVIGKEVDRWKKRTTSKSK